ncbi:MAG: ROK family protein, partial [Actinobacteria bacterium]|nr:ROK family protein [Actinomycetota bacterium]
VLLYMGVSGDLNPLYTSRNYAGRTHYESPIVPVNLVAGILNAFNPEVVVLGGGVIGIEGFFDRMLREVDLRALQRPRQAARIATAALGGDAGLMGAVALAIEKAGAGGECPPGVEIHNR